MTKASILLEATILHVVALLLVGVVHLVEAAVPCSLNEEGHRLCRELLREGSRCVSSAGTASGEGVCSNPFWESGGCLRSILGKEAIPLRRICSSHETPITHNCDEPIMDYQELRILVQNWDSAMLTAWALQIFLSEMVRVPVSLEFSSTDVHADFYDPQNAFDYAPMAYDWDAMRTANQVRDCTLATEPCAHVMPEAWNGQTKLYQQAELEGWLDRPEATGSVGKMSWFTTRFTAREDPTLLSFFGLQGNHNRHKVARSLLTPTSWGYYCQHISPTNCTIPDEVAILPPATPQEEGRYFVPGSYYGHFRKAPQNDCQRNPNTCTGNILNVPCEWSTFVVPQAYWNAIPVQSHGPTSNGGYPPTQMRDIWYAANHTQSNILFYWYAPDALIQELAGTDIEFQQILLPAPTQECVQARVTMEQRCAVHNLTMQLGDPAGACDSEAHSIVKLFVANLQHDFVTSLDIPFQNPALQATKTFRITDLEIHHLFDHWYKRGIDKWGYDPRDAVCHWVADNVHTLRRYIPDTFPRQLQQSNSHHDALHRTALAVGILSCLLTISTAVAVYKLRLKTVLRYAQVEFLGLTLAGLFVLSLASTTRSLDPQTPVCILYSWLSLVGYTLVMVPVLVKMAAINTLVNASKRLRRVQLSRRNLLRNVAILVLMVMVYLTCYTALDPSTRQEQLTLTSDLNPQGFTILEVYHYCSSNSNVWIGIGLAWQASLLLWAVVLAIQTRTVVSEFNESRRLGHLVYVNFFFLVLRIIIQVLRDTVDPSRLHAFQSLVNSGEVIGTLVVYFAPMFHAIYVKSDGQPKSKKSSSFGTFHQSIKNSLQRIDKHMSVVGGAVAYYTPTDEAGGITVTNPTEAVATRCLMEEEDAIHDINIPSAEYEHVITNLGNEFDARVAAASTVKGNGISAHDVEEQAAAKTKPVLQAATATRPMSFSEVSEEEEEGHDKECNTADRWSVNGISTSNSV